MYCGVSGCGADVAALGAPAPAARGEREGQRTAVPTQPLQVLRFTDPFYCFKRDDRFHTTDRIKAVTIQLRSSPSSPSHTTQSRMV